MSDRTSWNGLNKNMTGLLKGVENIRYSLTGGADVTPVTSDGNITHHKDFSKKENLSQTNFQKSPTSCSLPAGSCPGCHHLPAPLNKTQELFSLPPKRFQQHPDAPAVGIFSGQRARRPPRCPGL